MARLREGVAPAFLAARRLTAGWAWAVVAAFLVVTPAWRLEVLPEALRGAADRLAGPAVSP